MPSNNQSSYTNIFNNFKKKVPLRGVAELATTNRFAKDKEGREVQEKRLAKHRLSHGELLVGATGINLTLATAAIIIPAITVPHLPAAYLTVTSLIGANTAALAAVATGGAALGVGLFVVGVLDILHRVANCKTDTFLGNSWNELGFKLGTTIISAPISIAYLLAHTIMFSGYLLKWVSHICDQAHREEDWQEVCENAREITLNFAAIILFPMIDFIDLACSWGLKCKDGGVACIHAAAACFFSSHEDMKEISSSLHDTTTPQGTNAS